MRKLLQIIKAQPSQDGDGVNIHRLAGSQLHVLLDPFLMIDEINSDDATDYIGGFPEHPHRGFETITYMKAGRMKHRDHMNNEGLITAGDVQWMTAGAGVLHSEMPEQEEGLLHGFQIWLNLPAAEKMKPAAYKEILSQHIAEQPLANGGMLRVIAGRIGVSHATIDNVHLIDNAVLSGPMPAMSTEAVFLDLTLAANETVALSFNKENPAMVYVYSGETSDIASRHLGVYHKGSVLELNAGATGAQALILSGKPIKEPIVQYGPFVMNTEDEIKQALNDFRNPAFLNGLKGQSSN